MRYIRINLLLLLLFCENINNAIDIYIVHDSFVLARALFSIGTSDRALNRALVVRSLSKIDTSGRDLSNRSER